MLVNNLGFFVTPTGVSLTPAPLAVGPPVALTDAPLFNIVLPAGTTLTSAFLLLDEAGSVVGIDVMSGVHPR